MSFNSEQIFKANKALLADVPNILDDITETSVIIENAEWSDIEKAAAFFENQIFSFSSTGKTFAIAKKDMTKRFGRLAAACSRLRNAVIMHRDYKDCISYAAGKDTFILLDLLKEKLDIPFLFLSSGECRILKRIGGEIGSCMYLCVYEHDSFSTLTQPL